MKFLLCFILVLSVALIVDCAPRNKRQDDDSSEDDGKRTKTNDSNNTANPTGGSGTANPAGGSGTAKAGGSNKVNPTGGSGTANPTGGSGTANPAGGSDPAIPAPITGDPIYDELGITGAFPGQQLGTDLGGMQNIFDGGLAMGDPGFMFEPIGQSVQAYAGAADPYMSSNYPAVAVPVAVAVAVPKPVPVVLMPYY